MSVYRRAGATVFSFDFEYQGQRFRGSTGQLTRQDAELVEREKKLEARRRAKGIHVPDLSESPTLQDWVEIYYTHIAERQKLRHPGRIDDLIRVALHFWGEPPEHRTLSAADAPYHNLRLASVVHDPYWIVRWDDWLDRPKKIRAEDETPRRWSGQTKNQYRSLLSQMFKLACAPAYRMRTGVIANPFVGAHRDAIERRDVTLDVEDLLAILRVASYQLRLAMAIALLTPKFREGNILALKFGAHVSKDYRFITVYQHKTVRKTRRPLVAIVPEQLQEILREARARTRKSDFVVSYRGHGVKSLSGSVEGAVRRAAVTRPHLVYGQRVEGGITFHTLRHSAATLMADLNISPEKRQKMMGHQRISTTMLYTHLRPHAEAPAAEELSAHLPIKDLVLAPWRRASATPPRGESAGSTPRRSTKTGAT